MRLSIVTTLYRSAPYTAPFHRRITSAARALTDDYEVIFVNDGSPDDSLERVRRLADRDPHVRVVDLSRNFGHHHAIVAGLDESCGGRVFLVDVDLEEDPELLTTFWEDLEGHPGVDVVFGVEANRRNAMLRGMASGLFWRLFGFLSHTTVPRNPCTVRLMERRYVDALLSLKDRSLFLAGNAAWVGFTQRCLTVEKSVRADRSSYTLLRRIGLFGDAVTSYSSRPLTLIFFLGLAITCSATLFGCALLVRKLLAPDTVLLGWSSLMASVWFIGGIIIAFVGVLGIYVAKVFIEVKDRPRYVVRARYPPTPPAAPPETSE